MQTEKDTSEPGTTTCLTTSTTATDQPSPGEEKSHQMPGSFPRSFEDKKKRMLQQPPGQLNTQLYPRIPEICQDATCLLYLIEECIHHCIKKSVTNIRKPLEVGLKLAIMLTHLATGEMYTSLQYHWVVGQTAICKGLPSHPC